MAEEWTHPTMTREQFDARMAEVLTEEAQGDEAGLWWLSFVDTDESAPLDEQVPGGGGFLGVAIVPGQGFMTAVLFAGMTGCNPGGQVSGYGPFPYGSIPDEWCCRLLTKAEADRVPEPSV